MRGDAGGVTRRHDEATPSPTHVGSYVVVRVLGEGANGRVYEVRGDDGSRLALKRLRGAAEVTGDASGRRLRQAALKQEYRVVADLFHPNLVLPNALEVDEEGVYFTMELVDGTDFVSAMRTGGDPDLARLTRVLLQTCSGLSALHHVGLVHRDVKPSNVLVETGGRVAILDFGLAGTTGDEQALLGTPAYLAPEVLWGEAASPSSDAYAVGVMLHEALTGRLPYHAAIEHSVSRRMNESAAPAIDGPPPLARICAGLLAPEVHQRLGVNDVIAALDPTAARPAGRATSLIGRDVELARLDDAWSRAERLGGAVVVRVPGRSGMGKSALLHALGERLGDRAWVLAARAYERDAVPHKAVDAAIDELARRLRLLDHEERGALVADVGEDLLAVFPSLREALPTTTPGAEPVRDVQTRRSHAARSLARLLRAIGTWPRGPRGVALLLDDVQWGDLDSARLLVDVITSDPGPLLVVMAHRSDHETTPFVDELARWSEASRTAVEVVPVEPLGPEDSVRLARALAGSGARADLIASQADGCPLVLEMMLATSTDTAVGLDEAMAARLASLSPVARSLLEAVCVAGRPVGRQRVAVAATTAEESWRAWTALARGRLVRSSALGTSAAVEPYHDRIRDAVARVMAPADRTATHRRLGEAFAVAPADAEGAATHLALAGESERALHFARIAARSAADALAFDRAARFLDLALECVAPGASALRDAIEIDLARTLAAGGRAAEAAPLFLRQADRSAGRTASDLRREAMEQLLLAGRVDQGRAVMDALLAELRVWRPRSPVVIQTVLVSELVRLTVRGPGLAPARPLSDDDRLILETFQSIGKGMSSYDSSLGAWFFLRAARRALAWGSYEHAIRGVSYTGSMLGFLGTVAAGRAERWITAGEELAAARGDAHGRALCAVARGIIQCCNGDWPRSLATFDRAVGVLRGHAASTWESTTARTTSLFVLTQLGDIAELDRRAAAMAREARDRGDLTMRVESDLHLALVALAEGDPAAAEACVERNLAMWTTRDFLFQSWIALRFRTLARLCAGRAEEALSGVDEGVARARGANLIAVQVVRIEAADLHGRAALAVARGASGRRRAQLVRAVEADIQALERERCAHARAPAEMLRGGVAELRGDTAGALAAVESARRHYAAASMRLHALAAEWHAARLARDGRQREDVEVRLHEHGVRDPSRWAAMHIPPGP